MGIGKRDSFSRDSIEVRGWNLGAAVEWLDVSVSKIVGKDHHNVGFVLSVAGVENEDAAEEDRDAEYVAIKSVDSFGCVMFHRVVSMSKVEQFEARCN